MLYQNEQPPSQSTGAIKRFANRGSAETVGFSNTFAYQPRRIALLAMKLTNAYCGSSLEKCLNKLAVKTVETIQRTASHYQNVIKHTAWRDARKQSLALLADGKIPCVLGPQGTGKSILLADLKERLELSGIRVQMLDISYEPFSHLAGAYIVDDAETLPLMTLQNVTLWAKACVLAGGEALRARLQQLSDRVVAVEMGGILPADLASYTQEMLRQRGMPPGFFDAGALEALHRQTGGIPKSINGVIDLAAFAATSDRVDRGIAAPDEAMAARGGAEGNKAGRGFNGASPKASLDGQLVFNGGDAPAASHPARRRAARSVAVAVAGAFTALSLAVASQIPGVLPVPFGPFWSTATHRTHANMVSSTPSTATAVITTDTKPPEPEAAPTEPSASPGPVASAPMLLTRAAEAPALPADTAIAASPLHGPGLVLLVREGDTLSALYAQIYQGLAPPSFDTVAAMNRLPLANGSLAVFPAPAGGWRAN